MALPGVKRISITCLAVLPQYRNTMTDRKIFLDSYRILHSFACRRDKDAWRARNV